MMNQIVKTVLGKKDGFGNKAVRKFGFAVGFATVSAAMGLVTGILTAPASGKSTRKVIKFRTQHAMDMLKEKFTKQEDTMEEIPFPDSDEYEGKPVFPVTVQENDDTKSLNDAILDLQQQKNKAVTASDRVEEQAEHNQGTVEKQLQEKINQELKNTQEKIAPFEEDM